MDEIAKFQAEVAANIKAQGEDAGLHEATRDWVRALSRHKYTYNFTWMGRPIIQTPQDIMAMQELIWQIQPDVIIETGIAHGGSLIFYASMLELLGGDRRVIGIDIDIRAHNRAAIEAHPMFRRIDLVQGSSIAEETVARVRELAKGRERALVVLDSNHTHEHVLAELQAYSPFVRKGSYCVVFDTLVEDMPPEAFTDRPWGPGNNPKTAVWEFLKSNDRFEIDKTIDHKLLVSVAPDGFLRCVKD